MTISSVYRVTIHWTEEKVMTVWTAVPVMTTWLGITVTIP